MVHVVTQYSHDDAGLFYCPVCGSELGRVDERCPHVLFTYFEEVGEFTDVSDLISHVVADVEKQLEEMDDDSRMDADPAQLVAERADIPSAICFRFSANVTGGGYAVAINFGA